ncbi:Trk system potassium uptake protein TrkA [Clostridium homopropionicum DSM 5847]|uniref:Trk system potassium uptake protein TrkA n=1 Tax=Clostridium homopropionicum DSM 5847 TaxID=1121318 RepID=A0A0L6Z5T6_9CLOT|nr:NAD-binding protein [Clostridium homopropionicum]KOA18178.1 Trk system potassium uptake protein TrkA [Clostridium homopropionicum DSM 5847]SFF71827.1 trk system potassium uptake protein TrkA [Clostridium homopropionicum]
MKAIIVGGGKVGYYLFKTLREKSYDVVLVERGKDQCDKISEELDGEIICGDGTDSEVLKDADIQRAEVVAAVTGKDEENLVICQMAKMNFGVNKTIARINNPKNRPIFKALGVDRTVCSTEVISNLIEGAIGSEEIRAVQTLDRGEILLLEVEITSKSPWSNKMIKDIEMPEECVIASIIRNDKVVYPRGYINILQGDKVLLVTSSEKKKLLEKSIIGG